MNWLQQVRSSNPSPSKPSQLVAVPHMLTIFLAGITPSSSLPFPAPAIYGPNRVPRPSQANSPDIHRLDA
ncbi:hypothetical protein BCR44DRAFT_56657 [Catenaria anguillulae PL171]|uniref:Uncharacterized protein n=1 Tax=Catenaria anguillulae PL171 TaxID=765915 RepID=A0A1Y2HZD3_9FUNG|nr:hypothetical protein BCR44DRAFT_56657 [Catenaria anguillulae PL171]